MPKKERKPPEIKVTPFTIAEVSRIVGITRRRLDYWDKTGLVSPSIINQDATRWYSVQDIIAIEIVLRLLKSSLSLQRIRVGFRFIRERTEQLATSVILTDGHTLYLYQDDKLLVDTLKKGQAVSSFAVQDLITRVQEKVNEQDIEKTE
jgi:DNA-binding transcriptional MerR regulator